MNTQEFFEREKQKRITLMKDKTFRKLSIQFALNNGWSREALESMSKKQVALMRLYFANELLSRYTPEEQEKLLSAMDKEYEKTK